MSLISSLIGSSQVSSAVNAQVGAGNTALGNIQGASTAGQQFVGNAATNANSVVSGVNTAEQNNLNPYLQLGQTGAANLNTALAPGGSLTSQFAFDPTQIANNPDYQFQLQQGEQAVQRAAAANGTVSSGGTIKASDQFAQGLASNEIGQAYNQAFNTFQANRQNNVQALQLPLQTGLTATPLSQSAAQNYGNLTSSNLTNAGAQLAGIGINAANAATPVLEGIGNAKAGASVAQGNIWGGFANNVGSNVATLGAQAATPAGALASILF